jgi:hypothetical protein
VRNTALDYPELLIIPSGRSSARASASVKPFIMYFEKRLSLIDDPHLHCFNWSSDGIAELGSVILANARRISRLFALVEEKDAPPVRQPFF